MLGCMKPRNEESIRSKQLDKELQIVHRQFEKAIKILLLGTAESGKTTILQQMKILHINGFTEEDKIAKIKEIRQNIQESIYELVVQMHKLRIPFDSPQNHKSGEWILDAGKKPQQFDDEYTDNVVALWNDTGIRECYRRSNEFQLIDSAKYFLDKVELIAHSEYIPSVDDILHSRKMTTGINQITFSVKIPKSMGGGSQEFRMFDVGGQRDQRNKWLQVFEGIQAVLFLISCSDFDQTLREDPTQNRLTEALELFSGVWHNRFLSSSGIIVFLNKQDIMETKIRNGKRMEDYYPDFKDFKISASEGNVFDECDRLRLFIKQKLINVTKQPARRLSRAHTQRECFYHFTVATDTNNIRKVFHDVHNMILTDNLTSVGLI
ncbi:Guanine nucleotide-binding protein G(f) subunit alpha [Pseudolycoriella hygida]|uniref:Guanine nucleotide-binding protein G(s) subunit alpha n=1 Tax=Pseudolycoriella hygida TaxID=35572 RepID=A0A9Q0S5B4_9DIPT|nr:Guanine nucleotide-binding protein G(f) subunit alpha [Pseudolycoriella hygida]